MQMTEIRRIGLDRVLVLSGVSCNVLLASVSYVLKKIKDGLKLPLEHVCSS